MSTPTTPPRRRFSIVVEDLPPLADAPEVERRLAAGLKHLLRAQRLRCLSAKEITDQPTRREETAP